MELTKVTGVIVYGVANSSMTAASYNDPKNTKFRPDKGGKIMVHMWLPGERAGSSLYNGKLSRCFDYVRNISPDTAQRIVKLIRTPATYGGGYLFCFYTDYALLIINAENEVCGYVSVSFNCNQLTAYPEVKEQDNIKKGELYLYGFSKKGYAGLSRLLSLTKDVGLVWEH